MKGVLISDYRQLWKLLCSFPIDSSSFLVATKKKRLQLLLQYTRGSHPDMPQSVFNFGQWQLLDQLYFAQPAKSLLPSSNNVQRVLSWQIRQPISTDVVLFNHKGYFSFKQAGIIS